MTGEASARVKLDITAFDELKHVKEQRYRLRRVVEELAEELSRAGGSDMFAQGPSYHASLANHIIRRLKPGDMTEQ